jgi:hypothetical protein
MSFTILKDFFTIKIQKEGKKKEKKGRKKKRREFPPKLSPQDIKSPILYYLVRKNSARRHSLII